MKIIFKKNLYGQLAYILYFLLVLSNHVYVAYGTNAGN